MKIDFSSAGDACKVCWHGWGWMCDTETNNLRGPNHTTCPYVLEAICEKLTVQQPSPSRRILPTV